MRPDFHRSGVTLYCGDCLKVLPTLPADSVDAVVTDPPYGISYQSAMRDKAMRKRRIANDEHPFTEWLGDAYRVTRQGGCLLCFCRWDVAEAFRTAIISAGYALRSQVIWDREWHGMGDLYAAFAPQHDIIWFATKGTYRFPGKRPRSIIRSMRVAPGKLTHPTEKPVDLLVKLINSVCPKGGSVLDPMMGTGSCAEAAIATGRTFTGIELDKKYFALAMRRTARGYFKTGKGDHA